MPMKSNQYFMESKRCFMGQGRENAKHLNQTESTFGQTVPGIFRPWEVVSNDQCPFWIELRFGGAITENTTNEKGLM